MKKNVIFLTFTLLFCNFCFVSICAMADATATFVAEFDEDDLPTADPGMNFKFIGLSLTLQDETQYYTICVELTSSNFKGIAANAGNSLKNDLYFLQADNDNWKVPDDGTTFTYEYGSQNTEIPKEFKGRCRDYGAHGSIQITVNDDDVDDPLHIPTDVYGNDIADGWEKDHGIYVPKKDENAEEAIKKAAADDERGPINAKLLDAEGNLVKRTCVNNGDGWSVYDEYRGVFTTINENGKPAGHSRLDPKTKNVMYSSHTNVAEHRTGHLPNIKNNSFIHVDYRLYQKDIINGVETLIDPFTNIYVYDKDPPHKVSDIKEVDSRIGRVNYNSNPDGGGPSVPGAKSVWSIRIVDNDSDGVRVKKHNKLYVKRLGNATPGSPSK